MEDARLAGDLNRGRLFYRLVTFGIPLVLGMFFHSLFNLVDLIIVGKLGHDWALAAVNQATLIGFVPQLISTGVNNASIAVISRASSCSHSWRWCSACRATSMPTT